ncbi:MAG TPA: hypothetical protein VK324_13555 [Tepidisphaeraceae bacterium]|nr:hypothetical protein [Tepidisphaeraceae bacterium]
MTKRIRELLVAALDPALAATDPPFQRVPRTSTRGPTYEARVGSSTYRLEIVFKQGDEAFSADLAWGPPSTSPLDPVAIRGAIHGSFRIDLLWSSGGTWWEVQAPPSSVVTRRSAADIFKQSVNRVTTADAAVQIPALVADFRNQVARHVLPYIHGR